MAIHGDGLSALGVVGTCRNCCGTSDSSSEASIELLSIFIDLLQILKKLGKERVFCTCMDKLANYGETIHLNMII